MPCITVNGEKIPVTRWQFKRCLRCKFQREPWCQQDICDNPKGRLCASEETNLYESTLTPEERGRRDASLWRPRFPLTNPYPSGRDDPRWKDWLLGFRRWRKERIDAALYSKERE